jgi:hypothetical protein
MQVVAEIIKFEPTLHTVAIVIAHTSDIRKVITTWLSEKSMWKGETCANLIYIYKAIKITRLAHCVYGTD